MSACAFVGGSAGVGRVVGVVVAKTWRGRFELDGARVVAARVFLSLQDR